MNSLIVIMNILVLKTCYLGFCFLFLFSAYVTTQTYLTSLYHDLGFISFSAIYFPYALTSLISPFIGKRIGVKLSILLGSATYVLWIASMMSDNYIFLIIASILNGIGCGLLWVHQGIYINKLIVQSTQNKEDNLTGLLTGIFFTIYSANLCIGSTFSLILSYYQMPVYTVIKVLFGISVFALIMECLIPLPYHNDWNIWWNFLPQQSPTNIPIIFTDHSTDTNGEKSRDVDKFNKFVSLNNASSLVKLAGSVVTSANLDLETNNDVDDAILYSEEIKENLNIVQINSSPIIKASIEISLNTSKTFAEHCQSLKLALNQPRFVFLIPLHALLALTIIFSYGNLPLLVSPTFVFTEVTGLFIVYGLLSTISAYCWGIAYDKFGEMFIMKSAAILISLQYGVLLFRQVYPQWSVLFPFWIWYVHGGVSGMIDTSLISLANMTISKNYPQEQAPFLFAWYRFFYCFILAIVSFLNTLIPMEFSTSLILIATIIAIISFRFF